MRADEPITLDPPSGARAAEHSLDSATCPALTILWSLSAPERVGECALFPDDGPRVLGRGPGEDGAARVAFAPSRPSKGAGSARPLEGPTLSRRHARIRAIGDGLEIERLGRATMSLDGEPAANELTLAAGRTVLLGDELLLLFERRPVPVPSFATGAAAPDEDAQPFGAPDPQGLVGETPAFATVRERIRFAAGTTTPLLVTGAPGSGREAIARAVHALSPTPTPLVAIDGEALRTDDLDALASRDDDAPTLLVLDIGEMQGEMQAQLARFATRLMSRPLPRPRLVATTTHDNDKVRPTLSARFPLVIRVPELAERRADVPLIARALLRAMAEEQPSVAERFFHAAAPGEPAHGEPRLSPRLVTRLVQHPFPGQVHELHSVLWRAAMTSPGNQLDLTPEVEAVLTAYAGPTVPSRLTPEVIRAALTQARGKVSEAARRLGLNSRFQLYRLMEKYDIKPS